MEGRRAGPRRHRGGIGRFAPAVLLAVAAAFRGGLPAAGTEVPQAAIEVPAPAAPDAPKAIEAVEPRYVRPLGGHAPESNDSNPAWSPGGASSPSSGAVGTAGRSSSCGRTDRSPGRSP